MKNLFLKSLFLSMILVAGIQINSNACTNFLITKGASTDGSVMISFAADSHVLYGELYYWPAATYEEGTMLDVYEWDTGKYLGQIKQARQTYTVVGNMNEYQVAIGETTYGGRSELQSQPGAIMDYGSLMYIALQRSQSAREAIKVITTLMAEYGYCSNGESFSISDANEAWIYEMIGKGDGHKGAVWVARLIPDGYICAHANQARITTFPLANGKTSITFDEIDKIFNPEVECVYSTDVISFARDKEYYKGKDKDFSFSDTYAPVDFGGTRFCEIRVWSMFKDVNDDMDQYFDYVKGDIKHDPETGYATNRIPLWIKPDRKISAQNMMDFMRDHLEGTELDMTKDIGAGPFGMPYRWRPLTWQVDDVGYCNERAASTQQTGFSFIAQSRSWLPNPVGGIFWFSVDDAASSVYVPMYCGITKVPEKYARGYGSMMEFNDDAAFWVFNQVSNFAYTRYNYIHPEIDSLQHIMEANFIATTKAIDNAAVELYRTELLSATIRKPSLTREFLTDYSVTQGNKTVMAWKEFYAYLFTKYMDGNIKEKDGDKQNPKVWQPGYGEEWYRRIVNETEDQFKMTGGAGH
ncbi:MAG: C69 family dipeptidase [Bacteroidales bacterium]|nr:C69 family dipeptidase [Bacteroidales bacterium]